MAVRDPSGWRRGIRLDGGVGLAVWRREIQDCGLGNAGSGSRGPARPAATGSGPAATGYGPGRARRRRTRSARGSPAFGGWRRAAEPRRRRRRDATAAADGRARACYGLGGLLFLFF